MAGTDGSIFAVGDCTATSYAPTAQVASQEGAYLARVLGQLAKRDALEHRLKELAASTEAEAAQEREQVEKRLAKLEKLRPFKYSHQGSLAYIGSEKAIADLPFFNGNVSRRLLECWEERNADCGYVCSWPLGVSRRTCSGGART